MKRRLVGDLRFVAVIVVAAGLGFFVGDKHTRGDMSVTRVTATEIANAMKDDRFYADYGHSTLVVDGTVSSISMQGSDAVASFKTDSSYQTLCAPGVPLSSARVGAQITVIARGADAERQPSAVFLRDCIVL